MNTVTKATKWMGAAAMAAVMFFGLSHKAEAQHVSFGVQIGGPVVVAQPAYPYGYGYYGNGGYYGDRYYGNRYYNNGYGYYGRDDWRWRQYDQHQRWDRDRRFDRDHDRGGWDRDHGDRGYGRR